MKKYLSVRRGVAAALALPGSPALAQTNEIVIGITITTTGPGGGARHSRTQRAGIRGQGNRRRAAQGDRARRRRRSDHRDHQCAALRHRIQGRHHHGLVDDAADHRGFQRRQRGRHSAFRPRAVPDHAGARQVVGGDAAADPDHGQGAVRAHEGAQHQDRRLYRLLRFLRRSLVQRLQDPGRADGHDHGRRGALCAPGYVGHGAGAEAGRRQSRCDPGRRVRHRGGAAADRRCASAATRA